MEHDALLPAAEGDGPVGVARCLRRLAAAYPAFRFSHEAHGRKGGRWVAERKDPAVPGLAALVTGDLMELHAAIRRDREARDG